MARGVRGRASWIDRNLSRRNVIVVLLSTLAALLLVNIVPVPEVFGRVRHDHEERQAVEGRKLTGSTESG